MKRPIHNKPDNTLGILYLTFGFILILVAYLIQFSMFFRGQERRKDGSD